jgi:hypothetical protein
MTKKHDEKVAAEQREAEFAEAKDNEKRLKSAEKKLSLTARLQAAQHAITPKS